MTPEQKDLLHSLAYLYLRHGQNRRALSLIMLAARRVPGDVGLMRTLAYAFVANGAAEEALEVIEELEQRDLASGSDQMLKLLKARALLHTGRTFEAKALFRQFVESRKTNVTPIANFGSDPAPADVDPEVDEIFETATDQTDIVVSAK
jgi:Flp pilus assembly protein TadD